MRILVWLLVLLNVALLVYFNFDQFVPKAVAVNKEINPSKLKLLMDDDFKTLERKPYEPTKANSCYKWGKFTASNLTVARAVVDALGLKADVVQDVTAEQDRRFWVYYPPLPTPQRAQEKAQEIRNLGVTELYIVQGNEWKNAISFGLFSEEQLATKLLRELRSKGVRNAVKSLRTQGGNTSSIVAKNVSSEQAVELYKIRPEFVGTDVVPVPCP